MAWYHHMAKHRYAYPSIALVVAFIFFGIMSHDEAIAYYVEVGQVPAETISLESYTKIANDDTLLVLKDVGRAFIGISIGYFIAIFIAKRKAERDQPVVWPR